MGLAWGLDADAPAPSPTRANYLWGRVLSDLEIGGEEIFDRDPTEFHSRRCPTGPFERGEHTPPVAARPESDLALSTPSSFPRIVAAQLNEDAHKPQPQVSVADPDDTIARNRTLVFVLSPHVTHKPDGFRFTPSEECRTRLLYVSETSMAEFSEGLGELAARPPEEVRADLGEFAPDTSGLGALKARIDGLTLAIATLKTTVAAYEELLTIAVSDGRMVMDRAHRELNKRVEHLPDLPTKYAHLERYYAQQSEAIRVGKARAAKIRKATPKGGGPAPV